MEAAGGGQLDALGAGSLVAALTAVNRCLKKLLNMDDPAGPHKVQEIVPGVEACLLEVYLEAGPHCLASLPAPDERLQAGLVEAAVNKIHWICWAFSRMTVSEEGYTELDTVLEARASAALAALARTALPLCAELDRGGKLLFLPCACDSGARIPDPFKS